MKFLTMEGQLLVWISFTLTKFFTPHQKVANTKQRSYLREDSKFDRVHILLSNVKLKITIL